MWGEGAVSWLFPRERSSNMAIAVRLKQGCFPLCSSLPACRLCVWWWVKCAGQSTQCDEGIRELRGYPGADYKCCPTPEQKKSHSQLRLLWAKQFLHHDTGVSSLLYTFCAEVERGCMRCVMLTVSQRGSS